MVVFDGWYVGMLILRVESDFLAVAVDGIEYHVQFLPFFVLDLYLWFVYLHPKA